MNAGFDPFAGPYHDDPAAALAKARTEEPVFYSPVIDHWVVTRYHDICRVFADTAAFTAANALDPLVRPPREAVRTLVRLGFGGGPVLANEDEPGHRRRRRRLARPFSRRRVERFEPLVGALVSAGLDRIVRAGRADLVGALLWEVPGRVVFSFLGVPDGDLDEAMAYTFRQSLFTWGRPTEEEQVQVCGVLGHYWQFAGRLVGQLERDPRAEGWIGHAVRARERSPELFGDAYVRALVLNGSTAGHETTSDSAANAIRTLLEHREAWDAIRADPALIPNAVEECLRYRPSVVSWRRRARKPATVGGVAVPAGANMLLVTASGNRDPAVFDAPDTFDIRRPDARRHLTFGFGNHTCLGTALARLQLRVILAEVTRRLPHLHLAAGQDFAHAPNTSFHGPRALLVEWDPAGNPVPADRP